MSALIEIANDSVKISRCFLVMSQLRPHLKQEEFISLILEQMEEGYRLAYLEAQDEVQSVAGYRFLTSLSSGYHMYVDDLVTNAESRSGGYGGELFDWLATLAKSKGCKKLKLDSGVQRFGAHRFYLRKGMDITCHHFDLNFK